ncbi:hypothetical protein BLNAU_19248 [Blattamonas nauphoetae]|uniref:Uncharacterized protein n=1 Tax=Blattamonas nauphoetae TaxID=2049346 RepID=A0ABQ9X2L7_9EUKA|nr:hypothetical protein BLNAU_19248 [Blattamonas nauphoetae]
MFTRLCAQPVESASTPLPCDPLPSSGPTMSDIEEVIRGYCSSLRNCSEKETLPILSQFRTFLESDLDELPTRCGIAESCGLVSILSDIVSSHSSVGLKSIVSNLLALIQNALGSRESQQTEHRHLRSHKNKTTMNSPVNDVSEQLLELHNTVCNMATQIAEQFGRMDSRQMKFDSILSRLDAKITSDRLYKTRFQRWSKTGADAIEIFDEDFFIKTGNTFTLRQRPEHEETNFIPKTLFSPLISSDVAQLSFTITSSYRGYYYGAVNPHIVDTATKFDFWDEEHCGSCWETCYYAPYDLHGNGAPPRRYTRQFVLEADCRVGQRTLKILERKEKQLVGIQVEESSNCQISGFPDKLWDLDELPTRCAIAESCGLVSILSDIVSSHISVGLRSIASSLVSLIQNAIGRRESQNARKLTDIATLDQRLAEIMQIQKSMLEAFHLMNDRHLRFEATLSDIHPLLNRVDRRTGLLFNPNERFRKQSKIGADAIEIFDEDYIRKTGNKFKLRNRPWKEKVGFVPKTLFSEPINSNVATLSLILSCYGPVRVGVVPPHLVDTGTKSSFETETVPTYSYLFRDTGRTYGVEIEVDTRAHAGHATFSFNNGIPIQIRTKTPLPFRFAIQFDNPFPVVIVQSLKFSDKSTLKLSDKSTRK